jgi:hypothetical protein
MSGKRNFALICTLAIVLLTNASLTYSQEGEYRFYYHSKTQQAIIISDLDGSNQIVVEETGRDYISGPGPSPSYAWFAYATGDRGLSELVIFSLLDGDKIDVGQVLGTGSGLYSQIGWSPNDDVLTFAFSSTPDFATYAYVFYPDSRTFLRFPAQDSAESYNEIYQIDWLDSDAGIAIYHPSSIELIDVSGGTRDAFSANVESSRLPVCEQHEPNTILNGRLIYLRSESNEMVIYDINSQRVMQSIELVSAEMEAAFWSPDGQYALLFFPLPRTTTFLEYYVWLYSLQENTLVEIYNEASFHLPTYCDGRFALDPWNNHLAVLSTIRGEVLLIDAEVGSVKAISEDLSGEVNSLAPIVWRSAPLSLYFVWRDSEFRNRIYAYQIDSENLLPIAPVDGATDASFSYFDLSDTGLIAYNDRGRLTIDSQSDGRILSLTVEYPEDSVYGVVNFSWHPSAADWLLVTSSLAGADVLKRFTLVNVQDGSQRFLTDCIVNAPACFGWLSDEV